MPKVTVLGGGRVGSAIALDLVCSGFSVEVADASEEALARFATVSGVATRRLDLTQETAVGDAVLRWGVQYQVHASTGSPGPCSKASRTRMS